MLAALAVLATGGIERGVDEGAQPSLTPDGRFLVYAQNPTREQTRTEQPQPVVEVFVLDRRTGRRELVSVGSKGQRGRGSSIEPSISDDGRFVSFCSYAPDFAAGDTTAPNAWAAHLHRDVFVRDRRTKQTTRISVAKGSGQPSGGSCHATISGNGRFVAFVSEADNLVAGDRDGQLNYFLHDRRTRVTIRLSGRASHDVGEGRPVLSRDGRWLAYAIGGDRSGIYFRDSRTGRSSRIVGGGAPSISADGRYLAYVAGVPIHAFVLDRSTRRTTDLGEAYTTRLSANGHVAATYWNEQVTVHDLDTGRTARADAPSIEGMAWTAASLGGLSGDGRIVPFVSLSYTGAPDGERWQRLFLRNGW